MNKTPRILLIDDDPDNLALLEAILEPEGYSTSRAASGAEGVRMISTAAPDLVLLDVMMPGMDGFAVCRALREKQSSRFIPVIMVTALAEVEDRILGLEAGADDFISKPYNDDLLLAKIRSLLKIKQMRDNLEELRQDFHGMIVHDLRAPVHSIMGLVSLLEENLQSDPDSARLLDMIRVSAAKIDRLITEFLELARLEAGRLKLNRRPVDLVALASAAIEQFKPIGRNRKIGFTLESSQPVIEVDGDPERLDQVFGNLLQNAVKFSPVGGGIAVRVDRIPGTVRCSVIDQGPGLPEGDRESLFEKFIQREKSKGGVGLGLYVCKTVIEAHGGWIRAENRPGGGAVFIFELPAP